ncbi:shikimate kinase [soil metagenome]
MPPWALNLVVPPVFSFPAERRHIVGVTAAERSIVLIGFMGTGKSSVGRRLAQSWGWPRRDTDAMIAAALGMPISEIFTRLGQDRFRAEESAILEGLDVSQPAVIVTGGGTILRPENRARLRALGTVVCLTADIPTLLGRLGRRSGRPLLETDDPESTVENLLRERAPLYEEAADLTIDTTGLSHNEVANAIEDALDRRT